jgi:membrane protease YdiL (CAAX protease family)
MARPAFCRGALLSLLLTSICAADEDLVRRAADAVHEAFVSERWADHANAFAEFHRVSMKHGAAPLSADTLRLSKVVRLEHLICIARERLEPALSDEHEEFGASVRALVDARQQLGAIADLDPPTSRLLQASIAGITTVIADASEARLRRELNEVDAALTAKRWDDCGPILARLHPRPKQLELDPERAHRAEGFAQQIFALTRIVEAERELELAKGETQPRGRLDSAWRALDTAHHPRAEELRRRIAELRGELDLQTLLEPFEQLEQLVAGLPPNGDTKIRTVQQRLRDLQPAIDRMPESTSKGELAARTFRLRSRVQEWQSTFASLEEALTAWAGVKQDGGFGHDHFTTARRAQAWLSADTTRKALTDHPSSVQLRVAIAEATSARDESRRQWIEEASRRVENGIDRYSLGAIAAAEGFPGQPELLARARARLEQVEKERERRDREEYAEGQARPARFRSIAWALYGVLFVGCAVLICLRRPSPETVEPQPASVLAALGRSVLALAICIGVGQYLVGYMFVASRPTWERTLTALVPHVPVLTGLSTLVCAGVAYAFWRIGWGPEAPPRSDRLRTLKWFVLSALLAIVPALGLAWGQAQLGYPVEEQEILVLALQRPTLSLYITLAFVVPIGEELLFRRLVYGQLRALGRGGAVVISSAIFAVSHLNPFGFLVYMAIGVALCVAYEKTGRLAVPIAVHALYNLIGITAQSSG